MSLKNLACMCFAHIFEGNISPQSNQNTFWMYFARLTESSMSVCDKYLHFVFNILLIQVATLQKLQETGDEVVFTPEPPRTKFIPSGRAFLPSPPLAWTLQWLGIFHEFSCLNSVFLNWINKENCGKRILFSVESCGLIARKQTESCQLQP